MLTGLDMTSINPDKNRGPRDKSVLTRIFMENSPILHNFLRRFLHRPQDIEDVVQETYLKAYAAEQITEIGQPRAYLFTIAKNIALGELLKKSTQMTRYIEECKTELSVPLTTTVESELEAEQSLGVYCDAIATLPEKCRRVFLLRKVHGLKQREIADTLGISLRMVEKHLKVGTLKCREYVDEQQQMNAPNSYENLKARQYSQSVLTPEELDQ